MAIIKRAAGFVTVGRLELPIFLQYLFVSNIIDKQSLETLRRVTDYRTGSGKQKHAVFVCKQG